jgi:Rha family phage regulatory protein
MNKKLKVFEFCSQSATDSKVIAKMFGYRHSNVIRKIKNLLLQFPEIEYEYFFEFFDDVERPNGTHKYVPYYIMTSDGFYYLCVSYASKRVKESFFNSIMDFDKVDKIICDKLIPTLTPNNVDSKSLFIVAKHMRVSEHIIKNRNCL